MSAPRHARFVSRTVFVKSTPDAALRVLNTILSKEGIVERFQLSRYFEPRTETRRRVNFQRCKMIYNEDMERKVKFLLRRNRKEAYPGSS